MTLSLSRRRFLALSAAAAAGATIFDAPRVLSAAGLKWHGDARDNAELIGRGAECGG